MINKQFEKGEMPTGKQICEKQLFNLVDQIEKVKVNEEEIAPLMPSIFRKLEWLDKEDIIKRMVSLEFNRMIDYYKEAGDIETVDDSPKRKEKGNRKGHQAEEGYTRLFINFGKSDKLRPNDLIEMINKCVPGKVQIGKIDLHDNFSFFEVDSENAQRTLKRMNSFEVNGRRISVEIAQEKGEGKKKGGGKERKDKDKGSNKKRAEKPWWQGAPKKGSKKKR